MLLLPQAKNAGGVIFTRSHHWLALAPALAQALALTLALTLTLQQRFKRMGSILCKRRRFLKAVMDSMNFVPQVI